MTRIVAFAILAFLTVGGGARAASDIICTLPVGGDGPHYSGLSADESLAVGPAAFTVADDGSLWIVDTVTGRLLHYDARCRPLATIAVEGAVGITDIVVTGTELVVLDQGAVTPALIRLAADGRVLGRVPLGPGSPAAITGLRPGPSGDILLEIEGGARLVTATLSPEDALHQERSSDLQPLTMTGIGAPADLRSANPHTGRLSLGDREIEVTVTHGLGGLSVVGVGPRGEALVVVEEVALADTVAVDQTVRRYAADGALDGIARVPLAEMSTYVAHPLSVARDGQVYALVTRPDRVEIRRLVIEPSLEPILESTPALPDADHRGLGQKAREDASLGPGTPPSLVSISRAQVLSNAAAYPNNWTTLSSQNINGYCAGRTKPRYLGGPGWYASVSYDWGGFDSVAGFNSLMASGSTAGDIHTAGVESCSRGVDCSGFVSRAWGQTQKYSTCTLHNISYGVPSLLPGDILTQCGNHVVLFTAYTSGGVYAYEATTYAGYDRVVYMYSSWSRLNGYSQRRYNSIIP